MSTEAKQQEGVRKRVTSEEDADRLAESVFNSDRTIDDKGSFDAAFNRYMDVALTNKQDTELRKKTFQALRSQRPKIAPVSIREPPKDHFTKEQITEMKIKRLEDDSPYFVGTIKGRVAYGRRSQVIIKGHKHFRLRDVRGRFISAKHPKSL